MGILVPDSAGKLWISKVFLRPIIQFSPDQQPDQTALDRLHSMAHKNCFLANSIKSEVIIES